LRQARTLRRGRLDTEVGGWPRLARWRVRTASPLSDALFAMAQEDLNGDSVDAITDAALPAGDYLGTSESHAEHLLR
jgi:hypothetical protein